MHSPEIYKNTKREKINFVLLPERFAHARFAPSALAQGEILQSFVRLRLFPSANIVRKYEITDSILPSFDKCNSFLQKNAKKEEMHGKSGGKGRSASVPVFHFAKAKTPAKAGCP